MLGSFAFGFADVLKVSCNLLGINTIMIMLCYCVVVFDTPPQARVKSSGQLIALKLIKLEPGIEYGEQCYTTQFSVQGTLGHALAMYESSCKCSLS